MKTTKLILILNLFSVLVFADNLSKMSPYTRILLSEKQSSNINLQNRQKQSELKTVEEDEIEYLSGFITLSSRDDIAELKALGVLINSDLDSILTAKIPLAKIEEVAALNSVKRIEKSIRVSRRMDAARADAKVNALHIGNLDFAQTPFKGQGVTIGIIDGGFEYAHPDFIDESGNLRVSKVWNQNVASTASRRPAGFTYGREYKTAEEIKNARTDKSDETHGTHVAGIAAGSTTANNYYGVAPKSNIILVSTDFYDDGIIDGIKYIFNNPGPCVVNLSLGSHVGPHDGTSTFDEAVKSLVKPKKLIVGAAGNEGSDYIHISKTITNNTRSATDTLKAVFRQALDDDFNLDIWGSAEQNYWVRVAVFEKATGKTVYSSSPIEATKASNGNIALGSEASAYGAVGTIEWASEKNDKNSKGNVLFKISKDIKAGNNYAIGLEIYGGEGTIHAWIDGYGEFSSTPLTDKFTAGDNNYSVGETGGISDNVISVGAYITKNKWTSIISNKTTNYSSTYKLGDLADFSSIGPTVDERIKPDITAPGAWIASAYNSYLDSISTSPSITNKIVATETINGKTYYYGMMQGTSMATPFVTGSIALWMQAYPFLDVNLVHEIFQKTATKDSFTTGSYKTNRWGYGKINVLAGLAEAYIHSDLEQTNIDVDITTFCYPNPVINELNILFVGNDNNVTVKVLDISGKLLYTRKLDKVFAKQIEKIDFSSMNSGIYIVCITGNNSKKTFKVTK